MPFDKPHKRFGKVGQGYIDEPKVGTGHDEKESRDGFLVLSNPKPAPEGKKPSQFKLGVTIVLPDLVGDRKPWNLFVPAGRMTFPVLLLRKRSPSCLAASPV